MVDSADRQQCTSEDGRLLHAALDISGAMDFGRLAERLSRFLLELDGVAVAGLAIVDPEVELLTVRRFCKYDPAATSPPEQYQHGPQELTAYKATRRFDENGAGAGVMDEVLLGHEGRSGVSAPILLGDRWLGFLFAAMGEAADVRREEELQGFCGQLAGLAAPAAWNCHTQERFRHGDQRRDTLITLSDAINRSLKLETVLDSTRQALRGLTDHVFSAIMLVDADRHEFVMYPNRADSAGLEPAQRLPLAGSLLEEVLQRERTYQSDDLARRRAFDEEGRYHEIGIRRCVAAPMFVRGRIIGCLLMGMRTAAPVLPVDVWLYENIALQLALAIDNARQLEQVRRLSEELAQQNRYLREEIQSEHAFGDMIGNSPPLRQVRDAIGRVGPTDSSVLITGETGVGKELVARAIHFGQPARGPAHGQG